MSIAGDPDVDGSDDSVTGTLGCVVDLAIGVGSASTALCVTTGGVTPVDVNLPCCGTDGTFGVFAVGECHG